MYTARTVRHLLLISLVMLLAVFAVVACGDDDAGDEATPEPTPAPATEPADAEAPAPAEGVELHIGVVLPETGALGFLNPPMIESVRLAVADIPRGWRPHHRHVRGLGHQPRYRRRVGEPPPWRGRPRHRRRGRLRHLAVLHPASLRREESRSAPHRILPPPSAPRRTPPTTSARSRPMRLSLPSSRTRLSPTAVRASPSSPAPTTTGTPSRT